LTPPGEAIDYGIPYHVANDAQGPAYPTGENTYVDGTGVAGWDLAWI
jgi:hypothetical protein